MEVILIQDVDNLGAANEVVKVRNGYARNYLIPRKLALEANPSNRKQQEEKTKQLQKKEAKMLAELNQVIAKLKGSSVENRCKDRNQRQDFRKCHFPATGEGYPRTKRLRHRSQKDPDRRRGERIRHLQSFN